MTKKFFIIEALLSMGKKEENVTEKLGYCVMEQAVECVWQKCVKKCKNSISSVTELLYKML